MDRPQLVGFYLTLEWTLKHFCMFHEETFSEPVGIR